MEENTLKEEKVIKLINYINENGCVPKKDTNKELASFYNGLKHRVKLAKEKQQQGKKLNKSALKNIEYYKKVEEALSGYKEKKNEQVEELICFINQHQMLPKRNENKELFMFYTGLQQRAKKAKEKQKNGQKLGTIALKNLTYYNEIEQALLCYTQTKDEKIKELIEFIKKNKRLPRAKKQNDNQSEYLYKDEKDMYIFYKGFAKTINNLVKKQKQGDFLTDEELRYLEYNKTIKEELEKYKMTKEEKVNELIKFIETNQRLPYCKRYNNNQSEKTFRDNTDMGYFYIWLSETVNKANKKLKNKKDISKTEKENLEYFEQIQQILSKYKITRDEKVEILIELIKENYSLPNKRNLANCQNRQYKDNTDIKNLYKMIVQDANRIKKKIKNNEPLTEKDRKNLEYFNRIQEALRKYRVTKEEKLELLIAFIHEHKRLPKSKSRNNGISEVSYKDKTDMNKFYSTLSRLGKTAIEKEKRGENLTIKEQKDKENYIKIRMLINFYEQQKRQRNCFDVDKIIEYLEILRKNGLYQEIVLFCEGIIENNELNNLEKESLKSTFERYIKESIELEILEQSSLEQQKIKEKRMQYERFN